MTNRKVVRRVGDVVPTPSEMEGEQVNVRDLVGEEFVITKIAEWDGKSGPYLAVGIELGGKPAFFFSSHQAIYGKLLKCLDELPLVATITEQTAKSLAAPTSTSSR